MMATVERGDGPTPAGDPNRRLVTIAGRELLFDGEGFLWHPEEWTPAVAEALADESGIQRLGEEHWRVLRYLREFFLNNGRAPLNRQLTRGIGLSLLHVEGLFPGGIKYGARRLAGLPNPKTCT
jgi:dissimilatory sulfite reductase related protein